MSVRGICVVYLRCRYNVDVDVVDSEWDEHREYWSSVGSADERVNGAPTRRTRPVNLRLPVDLVGQLKQAAARRDLPYQTLIRMWLRERVDSEPRADS